MKEKEKIVDYIGLFKAVCSCGFCYYIAFFIIKKNSNMGMVLKLPVLRKPLPC